MRVKQLANSYNVDDDDYKPWLIGAIVFLIIFVAFFGAGIYLLINQIKAARYTAVDAVAVDYKIVYEHETGLSNSVEESYYYIVEYEIGGKTYTKTCDTPASINRPPTDLGKIITVYVNPNDPTDAVFSNSTHILLTVLCLVVPVGGFVGSAFLLRKARRIKKDNL